MPKFHAMLTLALITGARITLHPSTLERRIAALDTFDLSTKCRQKSDEDAVQQKEAAEAASSAKDCGGRQEARTPDLRVANAALSQLS